MKKKFLSLTLSALMVLTLFCAACGNTDDSDLKNDETNKTDNTGNNQDDNVNVDDNTENKQVQLTAPVITLDGDTISWTAVANADGYTVKENGTVVSEQTALTYAITQTAVGSYTYTVTATSDSDGYTESVASNEVTYTVSAPQAVKLDAPYIAIDGATISWSAVLNADGYVIYENETQVGTTTATQYTITQTNVGTYSYTIKAVSDSTSYTESEPSNAVTYTVSAPVQLTATTVYFVGDSTVCSFNDAYYLPRYGYGTQFYNFVDSDYVTVSNLALSGRSSYSFLSETNYQTLVNGIGEGDYLIIGFGHNDEKTDIYTDPNLSSSDTTEISSGHYASFKYTLKHFYIDVALAAGATPILCTPIARLNESNNYTGSSGHITTEGPDGYFGGDYPKAIRELGAELGITVVDLTALTIADYTTLGYEEASKYHAATAAEWADDAKTTMVATGIDKTHTNLYGAKMNAYYIATELKKLGNSLGNYVLSDITKPTYETDYEAGIKEGYVPLDYTAFNPETDASSVWDVTSEGWYGTAFGNIGGASKATDKYFTITENSDGSFTVGSKIVDGGTNGKITSSGDGYAAVFKQISSDANFTITATVTIDTYYNDSQTGFGIMLRDDIYIDKYDSTLTSDYVAAGCYGTTSATKINFYRLDGSLKSAASGTIDGTEGATYELSLTRSGTTITVTMGNYSYTTVADYDLKKVDSKYMYLCLFATRGTTVTFSNVVYDYHGEVQA